MNAEDDRLHDAVAADNVRRLLAGTMTDPMPGTLAERVHEAIGLRAVDLLTAVFRKTNEALPR
jgi:hypothetical protein